MSNKKTIMVESTKLEEATAELDRRVRRFRYRLLSRNIIHLPRGGFRVVAEVEDLIKE